MAEVKVTELPPIVLEDFTNNDSFLIVDDGRARRLTKPVFQSWVEANVKGEKGDQGVAGRDGAKGTNGRDGRDGSDGLSAYQIAVQNGFVGSNSEWLESLKGATAAKGDDGDDGWSPVIKATVIGSKSALEIIDWVGGTGEKPTQIGYISESGVVSNIDLALDLRGARGEKGDQGERGEKGDRGETGSVGGQGEQGYSAYEIAMTLGFEGTEEEWALSLNPAEVSKAPNNIISKKIDGMFAPATDPLEMANSIDALPDKNIMTDAQKDKLESLKTSMYLGTFLTSEEIPLEGSVAGNYADVDSGEEGVDTKRWIYDVQSAKFVESTSTPASETSESVKEKYESNPDTNAYTDADKLKLDSIVVSDTGETSVTAETPETIKAKYESNADTNAFTDSLLTKLNAIPTEGVRGDKGEKGDAGEDGKSAYQIAVDRGFVGTEDSWLLSLKGEKGDKGDSGSGTGGGGDETPETIKTKYESNLDTNAFTDSYRDKLDSIVVSDTGETSVTAETPETIKTKYESNLDTNTFTDADKVKLSNVEVASPFLRLYNDKLEGNNPAIAMNPSVIKNGVGDYTVSGTTGLDYEKIGVLLPKDINGNYVIAADVEEVEEGTINVKTFERIFSAVTGIFSPDFSKPVDIPSGFWVELWLVSSGGSISPNKSFLAVDITGASGTYLTLSRDEGVNYTTFNLADPSFSPDEFNRFVSVGSDNASFAFVAFPDALREEDRLDTDVFGLAGLNTRGKVITPRHPSGYEPQGLAISNNPDALPPYNSVAYPPYTVTEVVNTITAKATPSIPRERDIYFSLEGATEGGTVVVYSYSTIAFSDL